MILAHVLAVAMSRPAAQKGPRWEQMELGSVFSSTIRVGKTDVSKAIAIRVGEKGEAAVCYDEDLLRVAGGWTGGFVKINPGRDALLGNDGIRGTLVFSTPALPGWALMGGFSDPRAGGKRKSGPLPRDWARYKGLYRHGDKVVLAYSVGTGMVLEHPWAETVDGRTVFTRTFEISGLTKPWRVILTGGRVAAALAGKPAGVKIVESRGGASVVEVRPGAKGFKVAIGAASSPSDPIDLKPLMKGGPRRWKETITTKGELGKGDGAYVVDTIEPPFENPWRSILHFGGHDFFSNGDAAICTMEGDVFLVKGIDAGLERVTWQRIATGLYHPLGVKIVKDVIHLICRDQIARLHDLNGDGEIDFYECFNNDCHVGLHSHEFATSLETDPEGNFYYMKGTNGGQTIHDSSAIRVSADGTKLERFATGFRWPNGMGMSPTGVLTAADQQGTWVPSSRIDWIERGGFYGFMDSHHRGTPPTAHDGPLCWIPHDVDSSCGGQTWVEGDRWGPLEGKMVHLSYGKCTLFLVLHEKVGDVRQGGVIRFPLPPFRSGAMRARINKTDGQLYVSGLKGWQTSGAKDGCLQRVRYTGKKVRLPSALNVTRSGVRLTFFHRLDRATAEDAGNYAVKRWNYQWTKKYGSPQFSVANPGKKGQDPVPVTGARLSSDGKSVLIEIADMKKVMQMEVSYKLKAADGAAVRGVIYPTVHVLGE